MDGDAESICKRCEEVYDYNPWLYVPISKAIFYYWRIRFHISSTLMQITVQQWCVIWNWFIRLDGWNIIVVDTPLTRYMYKPSNHIPDLQ